VKTIRIDTITILPNRQRATFDPAKLHEFSDGISKRGLLHPIILRPGESGGLVLVAGERRLRAVADLADLGEMIRHDGEIVPLGHIPYTLLGDLSPLEAEEAELEENIHRVDLTWQERAAAHERLAKLRTGQALAAGKLPPSVADIARELNPDSTAGLKDGELGYVQANLRKELIVAKHLDKPAVKAAKSVDEAFKILKKEEAADKHRALGASVGTTYTTDALQARNTNSVEDLAGFMSDSFDCIISDPPYGMGADEFGDSGGLAAGAHAYTDDWDYAVTCYTALAKEGFRITKPQAHAYVFCDVGRFADVQAIFYAAGWQVFRTPLIWYKRTASRAPWPEMGPQRKYETILYAVKGKRPTLRMGGDVLDFPSDTNLGHAAQKPVALYRELLSRTCLPGDSVIDPFMGTGPVFPAAFELRLKVTGIELDTASYGIAVQRISDLRKQAELDLAIKG
jgi:ParB/RepB/Spo0J family partition protein